MAVSILKTEDSKDVSRLLEMLGGMERFVKPGDKVLLKPNAAWDRQPEQAANTNPAVVAAVVKLCLEVRASEVWVTDVSVNDPHRSFARSGIEKAVNKAGGRIRFTTENDFVPTDLKGEKKLEQSRTQLDRGDTLFGEGKHSKAVKRYLKAYRKSEGI